MTRTLILCAFLIAASALAAEPGLEQEPNTWVKRSPLKGGTPSPGMGYECALAWDPLHKKLVRWGGHNQGGGGEQNSELWVFDPLTAKWQIKEPNTFPPGVCCAQQNAFDTVQNRMLRFSAFSGSHGWHWFRENYLSNTSLWTYDLATNTWRDMRPAPAPRVSPLRCAAWDSDHQVAVVFGGEGNQEGTVVYDPHVNRWTRMNPKVQPAFRSGGNLAYDAAHKVHVLFGSQFSSDPHTWVYDLRKNEWRDMKPAQQPATDRNDAILAYDPNGQVVIALVRVIDKEENKEIVEGHLETWAYDAGKNEWKHLKPTEPHGKGNRRRVMVACPDLNVLLMENYINPTERAPGVDREQQIWSYRYAASKPDSAPKAPSGLVVKTDDKAATLTWKRSASADVKAYAVYRGTGERPWQVDFQPLTTVGKDDLSYRDDSVKPGTPYQYFVRTINQDAKLSADSVKVRSQPRLVEDVVVSVLSANEVQLAWKPPAGDDLVGYHVERALVEVFSEEQVRRLKTDTPPLPEPSVGGIKAIGKFERLTKEPVKEPAFTDKAINLAKPQAVEGDPTFTHRFGKEQVDESGKAYRFAVYAYRIRAVNRLGVEDGDSPYALTIPSSPRWLFSKEDGEQCHLKWVANSEKGLKGYRVYRMESPRKNGPGQPVTRLTADPISDIRYTDDKTGKVTRRYWIVAVDALGQEGIPSAPTWYLREYRRFYEPFVGEWHQ